MENGFAAATVLLLSRPCYGRVARLRCVIDRTGISLERPGVVLMASTRRLDRPGEGDSGSVVSEIVDAFAELDSLPAPPLDTYTPAWQSVCEFQRLVGLRDGVMDAQTGKCLTIVADVALHSRKRTYLRRANPGVPNVADSGRAAPERG